MLESNHMTESTAVLSGVRGVTAPDGTSFDIMRGAPESAGQIRDGALVRMRDIVQDREPDLLHHLNTRPGVSAEYLMGAGVSHSKKPAVKADLTKVYVNWHLAEGDRAGAVHALSYANVAELPLPEYDNHFVSEQYEAALKEGEPRDAWHIATTMLGEWKKIDVDITDDWMQEWASREKLSLVAWAENVLGRDPDNQSFEDYVEIDTIFDLMISKDNSGFKTGTPSDLEKRVVERLVSLDLARGREFPALHHAIEGRMPDDFIVQLRRKVAPTVVEQFADWWKGVQARVGQIIARR